VSNPRHPLTGVLIAAVVVLAAAVGILAMLGRDITGEQGSRLPPAFEYDLEGIKRIDPALIRYRQVAELPLGLKEARAVAVGPQDRIYVAGDKAILAMEPGGTRLPQIALDDEPHALAIGGDEHAHPERIYVCVQRHVEVYDATGKRLASWEDLGPKAILTSIALAERDVLVADAGNRIVYRYDTAGKLLGRIGKRDPQEKIYGFIIPSPYFDVAVSADGLVRVANPGTHRIEAYTLDGHLETTWGQHAETIEGFCGCCNPANFAILPDRRFVTAEKGIPRVKVYSEDGKFDCVVAGPETLAPGATIVEETRPEHRLPVVDVAADSRGRVLVLDPGAGKVRVFEAKR